MKKTYYSTIHVQENPIEQNIKKIIIYLFICVTLLGTLTDLHHREDALGVQLLIKNVYPQFNSSIGSCLFIERYIYTCTNIMISQPLTLITHTMPYLTGYSPLLDDRTTYDIAGYFDIQKAVEEANEEVKDSYTPDLPTVQKMDLSVDNFKNTYFVLKNFVSGDAELEIDTDLLKKWNFYRLIKEKLRIHDKEEGPKILIFHTHARERYQDGSSVIDAGEKLKKIFQEEYGIETMHVTSEFYADDSGSVAGCYEIMEKSITKILKQNPSIEICIDIHRDGINGTDKQLALVNNKPAAKIMFVNGLCMNRNLQGELIEKEELKNPYIDENLAFSFQAQAMAYKYYPGLTKKVYFKEYRYSLHMKPLSLLVEIGNQNNTEEEVFNSVAPLGQIIAKVIAKD